MTKYKAELLAGHTDTAAAIRIQPQVAQIQSWQSGHLPDDQQVGDALGVQADIRGALHQATLGQWQLAQLIPEDGYYVAIVEKI